MGHRVAPISDLLLRTIRSAVETGRTNYLRLESETGLKRASIMRFVAGKQSLRLDMADRLADHFGLELCKSAECSSRLDNAKVAMALRLVSVPSFVVTTMKDCSLTKDGARHIHKTGSGCLTAEFQTVQPFPDDGQLEENMGLRLSALAARLDQLNDLVYSYVVRSVKWECDDEAFLHHGS